MYNRVKKLHIELTDLCNARCPQCIRTNPETGEEQSWIIKAQLLLEDFKKIVRPEDIFFLEYVNFCGNYGEPLVAKDLIPIIKYLYEHNPNLCIEVATNGSTRSEEWWWELLEVVFEKNFNIVFGMDGINQEQHVLYRQNTSFDKIMANAEFFISNGGTADWQYLIFKHNENSVEEARSTAKEKGFRKFIPVATERFWKGDTFTYNYKGQSFTLERSSTAPNKKQLLNIEHYSDNGCIKCFAQERQEAYIDCLGYVTPCCYIGMYLYAAKAGRPVTFHSQEELITMFNEMDIERLQARNKGLYAVSQESWFTDLTEMHKDKGPQRCYHVCGAKINQKDYIDE